MRKRKGFIALLLGFLLMLGGCGVKEPPVRRTCQIVVEESAAFSAEKAVYTVNAGQDVSVVLQVNPGYAITGTDYEDCTLSASPDGSTVTITLHGVRYSAVVSVSAQCNAMSVTYDPNGGSRVDGQMGGYTVGVLPNHLRLNTSRGIDLLCRDGYTLVGWNTEADGSGTPVGLGSRIAMEKDMTLYAQWAKWTDAEAFTWETNGQTAAITGYSGNAETVVIPASLGGLPVIRICAGAFAEADCRRVIFPESLRHLEADAFRNADLEEIWLYDSIQTISDHVFSGCEGLKTLHLNAAELPVYSAGYFATFQDKFDRLLALESERKIVLFSGSSTRFGYDSPAIEEAFPEYRVVNMGVFAYTNALPQLLLILDCMQPGDILLHAPEFDAAQRQFCTTTALDAPFFSMMEANYDTLARLDLRECSLVFSSLASYLSAKEGMEPAAYSLSPADFDEDGNPVSTPSYNEYGDYILYRPNADTDEPIYGLPVDYTTASFPKAGFLDPANAMYARFLEKGVRVYMTYAPRNSRAISEASTVDARKALDAYFRENLVIPVISPLEESLFPGTYFYGTDNHLSTEGVQLRTAWIIRDLKAQLEAENG